MLTGGIILVILGALGLILGILANSSDILSFLSFLAGSGKPGTLFIVLGIIELVIGIGLIVFAKIKQKKPQ